MNERYRLVRRLGGGGMAEVYLAVARGAEGFEKPVAIKRMLPHLAQDESLARMFITEAQLATHLHHQNIVEVFDVQRDPEGLFLVMELVNGWDLAIVFGVCAKKNQTLPQVLAVHIAAQVAAGLSHAYRRTLNGKPIIAAHRDVSPSNILLSVEGEVKVADFGIARMESLPQKTEPGTFKGKIPFAAPEVIRGLPATPASDQFGLGVVLYKMLTGKHPFGHFDNLVLYSEALAVAQAPDLPNVPAELAAIVLRMLEMRPEDRFPSSEELAQALSTFLSRSGVPASADELARYLRSLEMPPTPVQLMEEEPKPQESLMMEETLVSAPGRAKPVPAAAQNHSSYTDFIEEFSSSAGDDWEGRSGPALDASGRLEKSSAPAVQPEPPAPESVATAPRQAAQVPPPAHGSIPLKTQDEELHLSDEGQRWLRRHEVREASAEDPTEPAGTTPENPPRRRRFSGLIRLVMVVFAMIALVIGGAMVSPKLGYPQFGLNALLRRLGFRIAMDDTHVLRIESTPAGATVLINGIEVGQTPFFQENVYPTGAKVDVSLSLEGYRPWTGTFIGGIEAGVEARLIKR